MPTIARPPIASHAPRPFLIAASKVLVDAGPPGQSAVVGPPDAMVVAIADAEAPPSDAGIRVAAGSGSTHTPTVSHTNPEVARYIAEAEEAQRAGKRLAQMNRADVAVRLDPTNVKAKLLLADALLAYGDLERACKHLRDLKHNAIAIQRIKQAGCPAN
jgi:hypothetical protein